MLAALDIAAAVLEQRHVERLDASIRNEENTLVDIFTDCVQSLTRKVLHEEIDDDMLDEAQETALFKIRAYGIVFNDDLGGCILDGGIVLEARTLRSNINVLCTFLDELIIQKLERKFLHDYVTIGTTLVFASMPCSMPPGFFATRREFLRNIDDDFNTLTALQIALGYIGKYKEPLKSTRREITYRGKLAFCIASIRLWNDQNRECGALEYHEIYGAATSMYREWMNDSVA
jgi:hypothetical protein